MKLEREEKNFRRTSRVLMDAINDRLPVGAAVICRDGYGRVGIRGVVAFPCGERHRVMIRTASGKVHHRHYSMVERDQ